MGNEGEVERETTVEKTEETTTSVPQVEETREEHRVSGPPAGEVTEEKTTTTETVEQKPAD